MVASLAAGTVPPEGATESLTGSNVLALCRVAVVLGDDVLIPKCLGEVFAELGSCDTLPIHHLEPSKQA